MIKKFFLVGVLSIFIIGCKDTQNINLTEAETEANKTSVSRDTYAQDNYTKKEVILFSFFLNN